MARLARVVATGVPHHVTQRGNARQFVFESDCDHLVYLDLLRQQCRRCNLALLGYCLMSNHVHLIVIPARADSLRLALQHAHGRYAAYRNARHASSGHVWQGRFYSCPLDPPHLWAALRYTELNPVRAGIVADAHGYVWSSAAAHCCLDRPDASLEMQPWREAWIPAQWRRYLQDAGTDADAEAIRRNTHTGRPLGDPDFIVNLERLLRRPLTPQKGGRPPKERIDANQQSFGFGQL
jgi:putative transposase